MNNRQTTSKNATNKSNSTNRLNYTTPMPSGSSQMSQNSSTLNSSAPPNSNNNNNNTSKANSTGQFDSSLFLSAQPIHALAQLSQLSQPAPTANPAPRLVLIKQTSPSEEKMSSGNTTKTVHVVVKNAPFVLQLGLVSNVYYNQVIDLHHLTFDCQLVYEYTPHLQSEKKVDYVKNKPLEFKSKVNEQGNQVTLDVRIKVLTSQHEDLLFCIKVVALNPVTAQATMTILSEPIKVISKPEQLKKREPSRKRTMNDMLVETVNRIEQQQQLHQKLLEKCFQKVEQSTDGSFIPGIDNTNNNNNINSSNTWTDLNLFPFLAPNASSNNNNQNPNDLMSMPKEKKDGYELAGSAFAKSFENFLLCYNSLDNEQKPAKIRKLVRNCSKKDTEVCSEFLDLFSAEGLQRAQTQNEKSKSKCACPVCPYQKELEKIDDFYEGFLSGPFGSSGVLPMQ